MPLARTDRRDGIVVPGDKSISHRALIFSALAAGRSTVSGALASLDVQSTARVLRQLGAEVSAVRAGARVTVQGRGTLHDPAAALDCGNSGTTARLLLGVLAGHAVRARLTGDASLRRRPMRRVTEPLAAMGAQFPDGADHLPLRIEGGALRPIRWQSPVASAQVKSAILLAGLAAGVPVSVTEPVLSRDHTERMLRGLGLKVTSRATRVDLEPGPPIPPADWTIPGDPSSAAFLVAAALLGRSGAARILGVGINPTRTGFFDAIGRMGGRCEMESPVELGGEPSADLVATPGPLRAITVRAEDVPAMIDEIPILACLAARAAGRSAFHGLSELRVKESDRVALLHENLTAIGARAHVEGDSLFVTGSDRDYAGPVRTGGDHRIAMAFAVLDSADALTIDDPGCANVSFPGFADALSRVRRMVA